MNSRLIRGTRNTLAGLTAGVVVACSAVEGNPTPSATSPAETALPDCQGFPALEVVGHMGELSTLAFAEDPGCEIDIRRYPNDFDKKVGAITAESEFTITCLVDLPPPRLTGAVQESKNGDTTTGYIDVGYEEFDPNIAKYVSHGSICPPITPGV